LTLKVLAVGSAGGHWTQLMRLLPALDQHDVALISTMDQGVGKRFYRVLDANQREKWAMVKMMIQVFLVVLRERPHVVISTGAAPGYMALRFGRLFGARTIWVDSFANVDQLSMAGRLAGPHADLWLTQWAHLAKPGGPEFIGAVI
jgi:UDP-N-acetylglucosamine:LPS N-acetylglucosamine transferase